jgi:hypothetical protein
MRAGSGRQPSHTCYRTAEGRQRFQKIGRHGAPWTPETARAEARLILADKEKGHDPAADARSKRKAATVADLCDLYWEEAEAGKLLTRRRSPKRASTLLSDKGRIEKHIRPLLGSMKVAAVTREDIEDFMHAVAVGKTAARQKTGSVDCPMCEAGLVRQAERWASSGRSLLTPCGAGCDQTIPFVG